MKLDPQLPVPREVKVFSPRLKPLWLEALRGPEAELKARAAEAIAGAHARGMAGLADTVPQLIQTLDAPDQRPLVRLAVARTLIALEAREAATVLRRRAAEGGLDMAQLAEPALARWKDVPMRGVWLARLGDESTSPRELLLAIDGLRQAGEKKPAASLLRLATRRDQPSDVRLRAALASGALQTDGLENEARSLAADRSGKAIIDRLVAASLLARHKGSAAEALLLELAADPEPAAAAIALRRLREIDHRLVSPAVLRTLAVNADSQVRQLAAQFLVAYRTPECVAILGSLLDDEIPDLRRSVADELVKLAAAPALDGPVRQAAMAMLATDRPRGLEQAAMVLGALDHEPAAQRLVQLLGAEPFPVRIAAAWALRRLAVPATAEAMLKKAEEETARTVALQKQFDMMMRSPPPKIDNPIDISPEELVAIYRQSEQLIQALGILRHRPADPLLRRFFAKPPPMGPMMPPQVETLRQTRLRTAAMWALGHLYAGQPEPEVAKQLLGRLDDADPANPESDEVRRMAAISLGRIKARSALASLKRWQASPAAGSATVNACTWAIHRIEDKPAPIFKPETFEVQQTDWFLEPLP